MPDRTVLRVHDAATSEELWKFSEAGDTPNTQSITEPTVRGGVVYLGTSSESESVVALNAKTGERIWTRGGKQFGAVHGTPTLGSNGESLYVGTTRSGIYSLDAKTGETRWQQDVFGSIENTLAVRSPLVVATTSAGEVYAFEEDGKAVWQRQFLEDSGPTSPPTFSDRWIFVGSNNDYVYCLSPVSGTVRWKTEIDKLYRGGLVATDSSVYAASGDGVVALGGREGAIQWSIGSEAPVSCAPMIIDDTLYVGGSRIVALRSSGGYDIGGFRFESTRWTKNVGTHIGPGMAAGDGRLFAPVQKNDRTAELLALEERSNSNS